MFWSTKPEGKECALTVQILTVWTLGLCYSHQVQLFQLCLWEVFFPLSFAIAAESNYYNTHKPQVWGTKTSNQ